MGTHTVRNSKGGAAPGQHQSTDLAAVWSDVAVLLAFAVAFTAIGYGALMLSLQYARRRGSLSHF